MSNHIINVCFGAARVLHNLFVPLTLEHNRDSPCLSMSERYNIQSDRPRSPQSLSSVSPDRPFVRQCVMCYISFVKHTGRIPQVLPHTQKLFHLTGCLITARVCTATLMENNLIISPERNGRTGNNPIHTCTAIHTNVYN